MNRICFVHIEKAAGTSFHKYLSEQLFLYHVLEPVPFDKELKYTSSKVDPRVLCILMRFLGVRHFGGHCLDINTIRKIRSENFSTVTLLRDPVGRTISHYWYQREVMNVDWSLNEFLKRPEFQNFMCRKICGEPSAKMAIEAIEQNFFLAGSVEAIGPSIAHFIENLNAPWSVDGLNMDVRNARSSRQSNYDKISDAELAAIRHVNQEDTKLYDYVVDKLKEDGSTSTRPSGQLLFNRIYSKAIFFVNRAYSILVVRRIERILRRKYPDVSTDTDNA